MPDPRSDPLHVHVGYEADDDWRALQRELADDVTVTFGAAPPDPAAFRVLVAGVPSEALLDASPALTTVIIPFAGLPVRTAERLRARPHLAVHNLHFNASATAEMVLALLLAAARRIIPADRALRAGDWSFRASMDEARGLEGSTAVVLGYGAIGARVGRALIGMGVRVIAVTRSGRADRAAGLPGATPARVVAVADLDEVLPGADVLIVTTPSTDATRGLVDADALAALPRGAILVNVARGAVVDEEALHDALTSGHLFGAGLDVWYRYPAKDDDGPTLPASRPFHELDSVVLSPHRGGHVHDTETHRMRALAALLARIRAGEPLPDRVDPGAGY